MRHRSLYLMSQLRPEELAQTRSCEAVRGPPSTIAAALARTQGALDGSVMPACSDGKPCSRDIAERRSRVEIDRKRQEFPEGLEFLADNLITKNVHQAISRNAAPIVIFNCYQSYNNNNSLHSIIIPFNRKRS